MAIRQYENFIDGRWTSDNAGEQIDVIDPATEEVVGRVLDGGAKQAVMAIEAARRAFDEGPWPWMSVRERARVSETLQRDHGVSARRASRAHRFRDRFGALPHRLSTGRRSDRSIALLRRFRRARCHLGRNARSADACHQPDSAALSSSENPSEWSV